MCGFSKFKSLTNLGGYVPGNEKNKMELHAVPSVPPPYGPTPSQGLEYLPPGYERGKMEHNAFSSAPPYYATPPTPVPFMPQPGMAAAPVMAQPGMAQMPVMFQPEMAPMAQFPRPSVPPGHVLQSNVPQGLEYLATLDQVLVKQKVELLEAFTGCETKNRYKILDPQGRQIFYAKEDTDCCTRQCCSNSHPFDMKLTDGNQQEVIHFERPLACSSCCFPCCLQAISVQSPPGSVVGSVEQNWSIWIPKYNIKDETGQTVYYIEGPWCTRSCCCGNVDFKIYEGDDDSKEVGRISKQWSGLAKEYFTDADNFGIVFPAGANAKMKATLLGACMLIDFMFFEKEGNKSGLLDLIG